VLDINQVYLGDCLKIMQDIDDKSIDMILTDLPYNVIQCKWDSMLPLAPMWEQYKRIVKDRGTIVLFGVEPFSSKLRVSNLKMYKYDWIWKRDNVTGHLNAKKMPMRLCENISVFSTKQCIYNPQLKAKNIKNIRPATTKRKNIEHYGTMNKESKRVIPGDTGYPNELLVFKGNSRNKAKLHPSQKPMLLFAYLIKTYTNPGMLILDSCIGSGTTAMAAMYTGRNFIGIEKEEKYFRTTKARIKVWKEHH
jgi:site-specific DNA-methyltransferase (adenine-specific)